MPSENNLNSVFTDIANSIRSKKGTTDTIKPVNMADEIATIETGGGVSVKDYITIRNASYLFYSCDSLTSEQLASILKYDDTSGATSMFYAFHTCTKLTTIPLLNTSNVTNMYYAFYNCSKLTTIPLIDTSKVIDMVYMFGYCSALTTIPQLDTSKVISMAYMFYSCYSLTTIPQLNTSSCTNMESMFQKCNKLTTIPQLNTSSCTNMESMFSECNKLTTIPQLDTSKVTNMESMFALCTNLTSVPQLNTSSSETMYYMFSECNKLTTIPQLDTSKVINMENMFGYCRALEKIDITKFASSNNTQFAYSCYSLKTLIIRTMDTIPTLNSNAFTNCYHFYGTQNATYNPDGLKDGRIYVPDDKVETLKTTTNWSVFADIIMPLTIVDGEHISKLFIDNSTLSLNTSRNATIYLYGFTNTPTVNINVSNENIAQINNLTITTEKITFEVIALGEEGNAVISININGDYSKELSFEVSYTAPIKYRVEQISGATYGFALNSNEYYESTNKKVPNSYSLCKLVFNAKETNKILKLECINSGESNYDFGILSEIDTTLSLSSSGDTTNVYKSFKGQSSSSPVTITYPETTVGEHFIYIKYRKDGSGDNGNDSLQFKVI